MAINKRQEKTNAGMDVKKREPFCPLMEKLQIGAATMQNSIEVPQKKKKNESRATLPEIPLQGMYPKITKTLT